MNTRMSTSGFDEIEQSGWTEFIDVISLRTTQCFIDRFIVLVYKDSRRGIYHDYAAQPWTGGNGLKSPSSLFNLLIPDHSSPRMSRNLFPSSYINTCKFYLIDRIREKIKTWFQMHRACFAFSHCENKINTLFNSFLQLNAPQINYRTKCFFLI